MLKLWCRTVTGEKLTELLKSLWEIRENLSQPQDVGERGHKSTILKGLFTADDKSN